MVELGDESFAARAVITEGEERDRLYAMVSGGLSEYEKNTGRVSPVVVLEGVPALTDRLSPDLATVALPATLGRWCGGIFRRRFGR